jgi:hypothetical protein
MPVYAAPDGVTGNDGSESAPWPLQHAIDQLDATDDHVLLLLGGVYVGRFDIAGLKHPDPPYVISAAPGAIVVIDGTVPEFRTVPNNLWEHVGGADSDEYVSTLEFPGAGPARGSFLARRPYTRLITHQFREDLQSENELAGPICPDNPLDGPPPRQPELPDHPDVADRRPWMYLGPGLFHDDDPAAGDNKIHVRLSPTHHYLAGFPDYDGETDPRKVPLAIWFEQRATVRIANCNSVTFSNVTVRHGEPSITIADCDDVRLDHVNVYAGNHGIRLRGTCNGVILTNVLVDGGLPPWYFRSDRKGQFNLASDPTWDKAQAPGENTMKSLLSGTANCHDSAVRNCEFVNGHDLFTFGTGLRFSRNWIQNLDDDAIVIDTDGSADLQIFGNVIEQCQTVLSSGGGAGSGTSVFRNLIDLRRPFAKSRPKVYEKTSCDDADGDRRTLDVGVLVKTRPPDGPLNFFHNTCLVRDNQADASFNHFSGWGTSRREVFNNIFVAVNTVPGSDKPISFLPKVDLAAGNSDDAATDGNCFFRTGQYHSAPLLLVRHGGGPGSFPTLEDYRSQPAPSHFSDSKTIYGPGFEASSREADPQFRRFGPAHLVPAWHDDFRLRTDSAAGTAGVELTGPSAAIDTAPHLTHPAMGFLPLDAGPLTAGVDGRRVFPAPVPGLPGASHGEPPDTLAHG